MEELPGWICLKTQSVDQEVAASYKRRVVTENDPQQTRTLLADSRDAILDVSCPPGKLELLIRENPEVLQCVLHQADKEGLLPIDHIVFQLGSTATAHALEKLELILPFCNVHDNERANYLIRLLSMGGCACNDNLLRPKSTQKRLSTLAQAVKLLLPDLNDFTGSMTDCTPLHVAIRNYGFSSLLLTTVMDHYRTNTIRGGLAVFCSRNISGDLPLHLACRVGVTIEMLTRILGHTVEAEESFGSAHKLHSLIWSVNNEGWTTVDLVWIRHLFGRPSQLSSSGFRKSSTTLGKPRRSTYSNLLATLVDQIIDDFSGSEVDRPLRVRRLVGEPMHRSLVLIRAVHAARHKRTSATAGNGSGDSHDDDCILHAASAIGGPRSPSLPFSLLQLLLWQYPEQAKKKDILGRMPLHYAVDLTHSFDQNVCDEAVGNDWLQWLELLCCAHPMACSEPDSTGRLPLHYALDGPLSGLLATCRFCDQITNKLVSKCPQSVEVLDPLSCLPPFMQAACNSSISLETVYGILRQSPSVLCSLSMHDTCKS